VVAVVAQQVALVHLGVQDRLEPGSVQIGALGDVSHQPTHAAFVSGECALALQLVLFFFYCTITVI